MVALSYSRTVFWFYAWIVDVKKINRSGAIHRTKRTEAILVKICRDRACPCPLIESPIHWAMPDKSPQSLAPWKRIPFNRFKREFTLCGKSSQGWALRERSGNYN